MKILSHLNKIPSFLFGNLDIALDLGTCNTRIGIFGKGVVLREPTYIGLNSKTNEYLFFGQEAKEIFGKTPPFITVSKPIQNSVISDFDAHVVLIKHFLEKSVHPFFFNKKFLKSKLTAYTIVPTSSTEVEQKAIEESLLKTGLTEVFILEKPLAAAVGANRPLFSNQPVFIVDIGGGLVEMAVITMGGIVTQKIIKNAGEHMDKSIYNYLHLKYGIVIGEQTAEHLKTHLFTFTEENKVAAVRGKSLENGLPKSIRVKTTDVRESLVNNFNQIIDAIKEVLETIPPEIVEGVIKNGITLTGGLANIRGIDKFMSSDLKIPISIPDNPQDATINGILNLLTNKEKLKRLIIK